MVVRTATTLGERLLNALSLSLDLGDARLNKRALKMARDCLGATSSSLSQLFGEDAASAKAAQRFLSNDTLSVLSLRDALYQASFAEIAHQRLRRVIAAFDPTLLDFSFHEAKKDRRHRLGNGRGRGYVWLNLGLADPDSGRFLGLGHQVLLSKSGPDDQELVDYAPGVQKKATRLEMAQNYKQHLQTQARLLDERAPAGLLITIAADREFDDGLVLREQAQRSERMSFVIRGTGWRNVQVHRPAWLPEDALLTKKPQRYRLKEADDLACVDVSTRSLVEHMPLAFLRELPLDARGRVCAAEKKPARVARLGVGAVAIRLVASSKRARRALIQEEPVWLNLVVVRELTPPVGKEPLFWMLLTDLPTQTLEQLAEVVDSYVCRWRIEEFFRTTKDALQLEESRVDDALSFARLLFFITLKVMFLDLLRAEAQLPAGEVPSQEQRRELKEGAARVDELERAPARRRKEAIAGLSKQTRARWLLGKMAELGRWSGKKGDHLGNYVLLDGLHKFLHDLSMGHFRWLIEDVGW